MQVRILILLSIFLHFLNALKAQSPTADSLLSLLKENQADTSRCLIFAQVSKAYRYSDPEKALEFAQRGLTIAKSIEFERGELLCLSMMAHAFKVTTNYPAALQLYVDILKKSEDKEEKLTIEILVSMGTIYSEIGDERNSLNSSFKAKELAEKIKDQKWLPSILLNIGDSYEKLDLLDSARIYTTTCYNIATKEKDQLLIGCALGNLGNIYSKMNEPDIASSYYRSAFSFNILTHDDESLSEFSLGMAKIFQSKNKKDSALYYSKRSMSIAQRAGFINNIIEAGNFLSAYYLLNKKTDSANKYLLATKNAIDSFYSQHKIFRSQAILYEENLRQQERTLLKKQFAKERKVNMQYGLVTIGIIIFIILYLLSIRTPLMNENIVRSLGLIGLLLIFEFINLFMHPRISKISNHSPIIMLLMMVTLAALLIPVHRWIEKYIDNKLVKKNKLYRLKHAKEILEEFDEDNIDNEPNNE